MIKIEHLVKRYGSMCALDDVSFEIAEGEIVGFLGPNGAGKSTTMNIITGYLSSSSGKVEVNGVDILENPIDSKKMIGYLPEQPPLYVDMTVDEYLNFVYDLKDCKLDRRAHIGEICDVVKIADVRKRLIKNLSKGYRQRIGIAQALIGNPDVIILDEPTVGLDPKQIIEVRNLIRTLGKKHTVILSTHVLSEVQAVCERIVIINRGRIIANERTADITRKLDDNRRYNLKVCGPQKEVLNTLRSKNGIKKVEPLTERDGDSYAFYIESEPGVDVRKSIFYTLAEKNWPLIGLEAVGADLEDVFIRLTSGEAPSAARPSRKKTDR